MVPSALVTDLYELTMMAGYDAARLEARATFELFVRRLPDRRAFLVAAGLEQALEYLEQLRFTSEQIEYLRGLPNLEGVDRRFFDETLPALRFTGDVWAVAEGTPVFAYEPLLRVTAPVMQAQLVETALLACLTFQTSIASKAARIVWAASGHTLMEFGSRRAHGPEAGVLAARAAYIAGFDSTSNVEAGFRFGIPVAGTMAHSWVTSFADEMEAFRRYQQTFGRPVTFLIDTYDTVDAAHKIVQSGLVPSAVRLDSGDVVELSRQVRAILDEGGLEATKIVASGDMDEWSIAHVLAQGAPIDGFGVGTALATSKDAPALGGVYKLVEIEREGQPMPAMKLSGGKTSFPGRKQIWRRVRRGEAEGDVMTLAGEPPMPGARSLLAEVMREGRRVLPPEPLDELRRRHRTLIDELPRDVRMLEPRRDYPVSRSAALDRLAARTVDALADGRVDFHEFRRDRASF
ncbi:MAG: nicotinate phosphoribosyltransferase [Vicinamibacteraceae bacterium]|nr:nicotinate phosphoribosyltransferase [Vicinamibacteraceae bacterium]